MTRQQQPGWYPDPWVPGGQRWWDGNRWTPDAAPAPPALPPRRLGWLWALLAVVVLGIGGCTAALALGGTWLYREARTTVDPVNDFYTALEAGDAAAAYDRLCPASRPESLGLFERRFRDTASAVGGFLEHYAYGFHVTEGRRTVDVDVTTGAGERVEVVSLSGPPDARCIADIDVDAPPGVPRVHVLRLG